MNFTKKKLRAQMYCGTLVIVTIIIAVVVALITESFAILATALLFGFLGLFPGAFAAQAMHYEDLEKLQAEQRTHHD